MLKLFRIPPLSDAGQTEAVITTGKDSESAMEAVNI